MVSGTYAAFVPRAKLTHKETCTLVHVIKDWRDNIEVKNVWQFSACSVFGEAAMYSEQSRDGFRNATIVALEDSVVVTMTKSEYLV